MFPLRDSIRSRRWPFVNYVFIALNLAIFLFEVRLERQGSLETFIYQFGLVPVRFFADPASGLPTVFTSMFLHGSWGHVLSNIWFLYVFGDNVEDNMGHVRYFFYYLLVGFGAASAQLAANTGSQLPMVGASGAIAGVLGGYFVLYPRAQVLSLFFIVFFVRVVEIPAFFFLGLWFVVQALNGVGSLTATAVRGEMGGVAWWAHAGGFAAGFLFIQIFRRR